LQQMQTIAQQSQQITTHPQLPLAIQSWQPEWAAQVPCPFHLTSCPSQVIPCSLQRLSPELVYYPDSCLSQPCCLNRHPQTHWQLLQKLRCLSMHPGKLHCQQAMSCCWIMDRHRPTPTRVIASAIMGLFRRSTMCSIGFLDCLSKHKINHKVASGIV